MRLRVIVGKQRRQVDCLWTPLIHQSTNKICSLIFMGLLNRCVQTLDWFSVTSWTDFYDFPPLTLFWLYDISNNWLIKVTPCGVKTGILSNPVYSTHGRRTPCPSAAASRNSSLLFNRSYTIRKDIDKYFWWSRVGRKVTRQLEINHFHSRWWLFISFFSPMQILNIWFNSIGE